MMTINKENSCSKTMIDIENNEEKEIKCTDANNHLRDEEINHTNKGKNPSSNNSHRQRIGYLIALIMGFCVAIISGVVGVSLLPSMRSRGAKVVQVTGIIINTYECSITEGVNTNSTTPTYGSIVNYQVGNNHYEIQSSNCTYPAPKVGKLVKVLHNPEDPDSATLDERSLTAIWLSPIVLIMFSIAFLITSSILCYLHFRPSLDDINDTTIILNNEDNIIGDCEKTSSIHDFKLPDAIVKIETETPIQFVRQESSISTVSSYTINKYNENDQVHIQNLSCRQLEHSNEMGDTN